MLATNSLQTPVLGLVARADGHPFDLHAVRERLRLSSLHTADFGLDDEYAVFGSFVAGAPALAAFSAGAPVNRDDHPVVAYRAPRVTYEPDSLPSDRLLDLLRQLDVEPADVVEDVDPDFTTRLSAYWHARNGFLAAGRGMQPDADPRRMLARVREPLLTALRTSPDFRPAYDPLLRLAGVLARSDMPAARALLTELARAQPARPEAIEALQVLATAH
jgi:spermidine synthase